MTNLAAITAIKEDWEQNPRWRNVKRDTWPNFSEESTCHST